MSQQKPRTLNDINRDYSSACAKAGDIQFKLHSLNKDLEALNTLRNDLNFEAMSIHQAAAKAKAESEAAQNNVTPINQEKSNG